MRLIVNYLVALCVLLSCIQSHGTDLDVRLDGRNPSYTEYPRALCRVHVPGDWQALRARFKLMPYYRNKEVVRYLSVFSRYYFSRFQKRILKYQAYLNKRVQERNLPAELALLPLIESSLDRNAKSAAHAGGLWQLMPNTARVYGLEVSAKRDERTDLEKSTEAALTLLEDLYRRTNDWLLTIAAYNAGLYRVRRSVARSAKTPIDFWSLRLPKETRGHVAKFLALSQVIYSPDQYGILLPDLVLGTLSGSHNIPVSLCDWPLRTCLYCRRMAFWMYFILLNSAKPTYKQIAYEKKQVMTFGVNTPKKNMYSKSLSPPYYKFAGSK